LMTFTASAYTLAASRLIRTVAVLVLDPFVALMIMGTAAIRQPAKVSARAIIHTDSTVRLTDLFLTMVFPFMGACPPAIMMRVKSANSPILLLNRKVNFPLLAAGGIKPDIEAGTHPLRLIAG